MNDAIVLIVCTANVCRSPVGAALLQEFVAGSGVIVKSAGTHAVIGLGPVPEAVNYIHRRTGTVLQSRGTQLTRRHAEGADLILTMTEAQRTSVVQSAPSALRRVFTLRQFVRVASYLPDGSSYPSVIAVAEAVARFRALAGPAEPIGDDIEDPYGATPAVYQQSFGIIEDAVARTSAVLVARIRPRAER